MNAVPNAPRLLLLKNKNRHLYDLIRYLSKQRFTDISARPVTVVRDHDQPDDFVYGSHQTVIQIASRDLRITFKSHFKLGNTKALTERNPSKNTTKTLAKTPKQSQRSTYDLFMEYSNLVAGGISQHLHANGIVAGISLPMATSGFDELISSDELRETSYFDYWIIAGENYQFTCTVCVDLLTEEWLKTFHFDEPQGADASDEGIEIL